MTDNEFLLYAYKGSQAAVDLALDYVRFSQVYDDLIDRDKAIAPTALTHELVYLLLVKIPRNPVYVRHMADLQPVVEMGIANWKAANAFESGSLHERRIAHTLRYGASTVMILLARLLGGQQWAEEVAPEMWRRCHRDEWEHYEQELEKRNGPPAP